MALVHAAALLSSHMRVPPPPNTRFARSASQLRTFPQTTTYLLNEAIVAISDTTIATLFAVIASDKLHMASSDVAAVMSTSIVFVVISNLIAGEIMKRELVTATKLILLGRLGIMCNQLYFAFAVDTVKEFWISGVFFGIFNGLLGVTSTQLFSSLIPPVYKSEFFALRSVNSKLLAWIGPLVFGIINSYSFSLAVASLTVYTIIGSAFLMCVDVQKGVQTALNFEEGEQESTESSIELSLKSEAMSQVL